MASVNEVRLIGRLTADPEIRYIQSGTAVCNVDIAVNEKFKKQDEWVESVVFVPCELWGRTAEVTAEYMKKGSLCYIAGRLKLDQWEQEGQKRSKLKVVAEKMQMLSSKGGGGGGGGSQDQYSEPIAKPRPQPSQGQSRMDSQSPDDEDIPF